MGQFGRTMKLEAFTLCDAATADNSGKLNILGAFDSLFAPTAPLTHPACSVALRMRFDAVDEGTHAIELRLVNSDGQGVLPPMKANVGVNASPDLRTISRNFVLNIQQLKLPHFGEYRVDLFYDGAPVGSIPLYAMQNK